MSSTPPSKTDATRWFTPRLWFGPLVVAVVAFGLTVVAIDPGGDLPNWPGGPGVTLDEGYNVGQGVYLVRQSRAYGWGALLPESQLEIYSEPFHNPDHPPLGRIWLGVAHEIAASNADLGDEGWRVVYGRFGSAFAFAVTILLVGWTAARWYGMGTGICTAIALLMMPRVFGHAHLASLETVTGLFYALATLGVACCWTKSTAPTKKAAIGCGFLWGLAMLTKIQGLLLCIPIGLWALIYWRQKSIVPLLLWGITGTITLFAFWPWLWHAPVDHLMKYLGRTTDRTPIKVFYLGIVYTDRTVPEWPEYTEVPWHYPLVMFLVTVPLGLQLCGFAGLNVKSDGRRIDGRLQVVLAAMIFPIILFCIPGIAVYDGARLFLVSFPLWAIAVGRGSYAAWNWLAEKTKLFGQIVWVTVFYAAQLIAMFVLHPCLLSYYNLGVGSLRGAAELGFEPTYWGDSIHRDFQSGVVKALPEGTRLGVVPVLDLTQIPLMQSQSRIFQSHGITLVPFDPSMADRPQYVLTFFRKADHSAELTELLSKSKIVVEYRRQNVLLAAVYELPSAR